jgi:trafficking protein particle complex subunit 8
VTHTITNLHPHIPALSHPSIFPLYNPTSTDIVVFWEIPSQQRSGHLLLSGIALGSGHAALQGIIEDAEGLKVRRSMYAETRREKEEILDAIRRSEWNVEMNPIVVDVQGGVRIEHDFSEGCVAFFVYSSRLMLDIVAVARCR